MAIAIHQYFFGSDADSRWLQRFGRLENQVSELPLQVANIWFLLVRPVVEFQHGSVVRVRGDEKDVLDTGRPLDALVDDSRRLPRRRPAQVEADNGDLFF